MCKYDVSNVLKFCNTSLLTYLSLSCEGVIGFLSIYYFSKFDEISSKFRKIKERNSLKFFALLLLSTIVPLSIVYFVRFEEDA